MSAIDWTHIYKEYAGLWVALKDDEVTVVGSGKTAKDALDQARQNNYPDASLMRVPKHVVPFVGSPTVPSP